MRTDEGASYTPETRADFSGSLWKLLRTDELHVLRLHERCGSQIEYHADALLGWVYSEGMAWVPGVLGCSQQVSFHWSPCVNPNSVIALGYHSALGLTDPPDRCLLDVAPGRRRQHVTVGIASGVRSEHCRLARNHFNHPSS